MSETEFCPLPSLCQPLLDKFYRAHRSPMRSSGAAQVWVARQQEIIGALSLAPVADGYWLTGLFVAPQWRGRTIAGQLIASALEGQKGPIWLFCHPDLVRFYEQSGFTPTTDLPPMLADKLARYQKTKALMAMQRKG
ncbi:Acetyltransferase, GNAT protein [Pseudomonas savastanoi pv. glycinea]|nr:Acetyltransferase, GNAT protein [Pseudomonas savastanoi pv. glycinea]